MPTYNGTTIKNYTQFKNTKSGIAEFVLIAPLSWFATIETPTAPFANPGDEVRILKKHTFKEGFGWIKLGLAPSKSNQGYSTTGDTGLKSFQGTVTAVAVGGDAELAALVKALLNEPLIVLTRDSDCSNGTYKQLGDRCMAARYAPEFTSGTAGGDGFKGWTLTFTGDTDPLFYSPADGTIAEDIIAEDYSDPASSTGGNSDGNTGS